MTTPLLATKLFAPPPPLRVMERQRLMQRLDAGLQGKLTLVCAPAGFGKSTLLGAWVQACEQPSAWLSLDEGDRDPNQFAAYLTASLRSVSADLGDGALALAQARPRPPPETVLIHLINRLAMRRGRLVLVLDDYQFASGPEVDALLAFLIDNQPAPLHLIVISREVPAIPLARLRSGGQVLDLGPQDLRFAAEETRLFLNQSMALGLTDPQIQALDARTEGWPAGLQMAAVSLARQSDADSFIRSFTGSHGLAQDYLLEEVLQRLPEGVSRSCCGRRFWGRCVQSFVMQSCRPRSAANPCATLTLATCLSCPLTRNDVGSAITTSSAPCCSNAFAPAKRWRPCI